MRVLKYSILVISILLLHLYCYQSSFIELLDSNVPNFLSLFFGEQHSMENRNSYLHLNLTISIFLSLITVYLVSSRHYIYLFTLFLLTLSISSLWFLFLSSQHIYVHIIYLGIPYTISFIMLSLIAVFTNAQEKKKQQLALEHAQETALKSMMTIIKIHDKETGEHIIRTQEYTKVLATYLYKNKIYPKIITPTFITHLYKTAPLHDIGKIGIPDVVLKKNGKLTRTEFEMIKEHSTLGKEIVENFLTDAPQNNFFTILQDVVYYHHEHWDGKGYPCQLKGDEIPLSAQIIALADVYDALVTKRRYKDSFSYAKADSIIIEGRGTHFNPLLIDAFLEVRTSFHEISDQWKDKNH